jgi:Co/Zn/Cd efflux system component
MAERDTFLQFPQHDHVFLGRDHERAERRTWAVIILCTVMMIAEIIGGALFGSLALIADGLHMSTHAGALLLAALAYTYARKYAGDRSFSFGTGKFGDLAGYSSAIVLAMIALLIGYEAITRFIDPVPIAFNEAIPIAVLGLAVNVASAWLLAGGLHVGMTMMTGTNPMRTSMAVAGTIVTTTCAPRSFTSWRTLPFRFLSLPVCCWRAPSAGCGWTRWLASSARSSSPIGRLV